MGAVNIFVILIIFHENVEETLFSAPFYCPSYIKHSDVKFDQLAIKSELIFVTSNKPPKI